MMTLLETIKNSADELDALFKDFHAHPELGLEETRTAAIVAEKLRAFGVDEVHEGIGITGVVGVIRGQGQGNRCVGLRADMDALPIDEISGLAYASTHPGKMHACGHDGHTTALLGAAKYLAATRAFDGTVVLIFQPAEEGLGGARAMLADDLLTRFPCDELYGLHNAPFLPPGQMRICKGSAMAGAQFFDIKVTGVGSHAARPHGARDAVVIASALVGQMQSVVARNVAPLDACVLSVTQIHAGAAYNVIPETATLAGTIRYFKGEVRDLAMRRIAALCDGLSHAYEVEITFECRNVFNVLENDNDLSDAYLEAAADVFGADHVAETTEPATGSEDFADMLRQVPGAYAVLGHSGEVQLHNPAFVLGKEFLTDGAALLARIAERRLALS